MNNQKIAEFEHIDPTAQFQACCGDVVVYIPEGIVANVCGYEWEMRDGVPRIVYYILGCGIKAEASLLRRYNNELEKRGKGNA